MTKQFVQTYPEYIDKFDDLHYAYALCLLEDRMKSSLKREQFHDQFGTFVIFTIEELRSKLKCSRGKAINALKFLVQNGFLIKRRQFNGATKLYLPKYKKEAPKPNSDNQSIENELPKVSKTDSNHSHFNHKIKHVDTVDTEKTDEKSTSNYEIESFINAVVGKSKMNGIAVSNILKFTQYDLKKAEKIVGLVFSAKKHVAKKYGLLNKKISKFEHNYNLINKLAPQIQHILSYSQNKKKPMGYIYNSLITFFKDAFGLIKDEITKPKDAESKRDQVTKKNVPYWLRKDYRPNVKPASAEKIAAVKQKLREFRNETN